MNSLREDIDTEALLNWFTFSRATGSLPHFWSLLRTPRYDPFFFTLLPPKLKATLRILCRVLPYECFDLVKDWVTIVGNTDSVSEKALEGTKGFSVSPNDSTRLFARVRPRGIATNASAMTTEDLLYCFQRYGFISAEHIAGNDYYIELDSSEQVTAAVSDRQPHPYIQFMAFCGNDFSATDLKEAHLLLSDHLDEHSMEGKGTTEVPSLVFDPDHPLLHTDGFVPDLVVDNISPYITDEQLTEYFREYGTVEELRMSTNDRSGMHYGCAVVQMKTAAEAFGAADGLHEKRIMGKPILVGYVNPALELCNLRTGNPLRIRSTKLGRVPKHFNVENNMEQETVSCTRFPREEPVVQAGSVSDTAWYPQGNEPPSRSSETAGTQLPRGIVCYYCREPGHTIHMCPVRSREMVQQGW